MAIIMIVSWYIYQYLTGRLDEQNDGNEEFSKKLESEMKISYPESFKIANEIYDQLQNKLAKKLSGSNYSIS